MGQRGKLACIAYVVEGSGFWASGLRSMIANIYRESGAAARLKIDASVDAIAEWLSLRHKEVTGVAISEAELRSVLLRARSFSDG
jgi:hypothetical protein